MNCEVCGKPAYGGSMEGMPLCTKCFQTRPEEVKASIELWKQEQAKPEPVKQTVVCNHCGSDEITGDASAEWNVDTQEWELIDVYEKGGYCGGCDSHDARWSFKDIDGTVDPVRHESSPRAEKEV